MSTSRGVYSANSPFEESAKLAYDVFAHRTGRTIAWELLSTQEQIAWREVAAEVYDQFMDDPERHKCPTCDVPLVCPSCHEPECTPVPVTQEAEAKSLSTGGAL
jgi:uncharacterized protein with PIN domain